ncbi:class II glutamine amidotransferase [Labrenzia sp. 011]|uniref:class II glutamine amidotransferase n=1 Tax=Labrenzia sp. 011 TaxID=2171494 RepID=UPI000D520D7A|nr:class II glutamine amidotransferase [Labrenzia sp. 011]PVB60173.1 class II glutamine amidotransferase [Labrenzia sp. 011]
MCRWAAWSGAPRYLEEVICDPAHSLIAQSRNAVSCKTAVNADGFGISWYGDRQIPCLYKDVRPAWSDPNLLQIARHVRSGHFLAHVRASTGTATARDNCHPFTHDRWTFMHNGQVGGYDKVRRRLDNMIPDDLYRNRMGATDSESLFLVAVAYGLDLHPRAAMARAVFETEALSRYAGTAPHMRFAAAWSNGDVLYAARYASDRFAPTLYYREFGDGVMIVSEPLDGARDCWREVPQGQMIEVRAGKVEQMAFLSDEELVGA